MNERKARISHGQQASADDRIAGIASGIRQKLRKLDRYLDIDDDVAPQFRGAIRRQREHDPKYQKRLRKERSREIARLRAEKAALIHTGTVDT